MRKHLSNIEKSILFGLVFSVLLSFANTGTACDDIKNNVLRLHIIANSDNSTDQAVKLKIRDELLACEKDLFSECRSIDEAEKIANKNLSEFERKANKIIKESDLDYKATAKIKKTYFETRKYDDFTLPAGYYNSLQISLGKGRGHNWWCVVYPTVCLSSSKAELSDSVGEKGTKLAKNQKNYILKFKSIELYEKLKKSIKKYGK